MLRTGQYGFVSACTRILQVYHTGLYQAQHEPQRIRVVYVFVVEERKTCSHGTARHGTRTGVAYMCALSRSPTTEESEDF